MIVVVREEDTFAAASVLMFLLVAVTESRGLLNADH
jgi:hypothetical protein